MASLSQGRTAAVPCGLFTHKSVPVIFEPPCSFPFYLRTSRAFSLCFHKIVCEGVTLERKLVIMPWSQNGTEQNNLLSPITFQNHSKIASNVAEMWALKCSLEGVPYFLFLWMSVSEAKGQPWRHRHR